MLILIRNIFLWHNWTFRFMFILYTGKNNMHTFIANQPLFIITAVIKELDLFFKIQENSI